MIHLSNHEFNLTLPLHAGFNLILVQYFPMFDQEDYFIEISEALNLNKTI
jgi:hypothetical protein